jgi:hypothetical protein
MTGTPAGARSTVSLSAMSHFELSFSSIAVTGRRQAREALHRRLRERKIKWMKEKNSL